MMNYGRFILGLLSVLFTVCISAQAVNKGQSEESRTKTLWVVDGVALNDSVFDYTINRMRSDSAAILACSVLSWVYPDGIKRITVIDSINATKSGFLNCNGVVEITTTIREPLIIVINGYLYKSNEKATAEEILGGYNSIQHIVRNEFRGLDECGIRECSVSRQMNIGCHPIKYPLVLITTELPYYRSDIFEGKYLGKRGRQSYELILNSDSTYVLTQKSLHKKSVAKEVVISGIWEISKGDIILYSSQEPETTPHSQTSKPEAVRLMINSAKTLTLQKNTWLNKKSITLNRATDFSDP